ncbi:hypothetical protein PS1_023764 [Malus domestica]
MAACATFVGTVTYMSRLSEFEMRIILIQLIFAALVFECETGEFPFTSNEGPHLLLLHIISMAYIRCCFATKVLSSMADLG